MISGHVGLRVERDQIQLTCPQKRRWWQFWRPMWSPQILAEAPCVVRPNDAVRLMQEGTGFVALINDDVVLKWPRAAVGRCKACSEPVSLERGITAVGDLNAEGVDYYCEPCAPNQGSKGYTLADLEQWRNDGQVERAKYEMSLVDLVGADVYFAVKGASKPSPIARLLEMNRRMYEKLRELGVGE